MKFCRYSAVIEILFAGLRKDDIMVRRLFSNCDSSWKRQWWKARASRGKENIVKFESLK